MISRIRIDASGKTPNDVADTLYPHAGYIQQMLGVHVERGECVIERDQNEPEESNFAFKGRLNLHPDISKPLQTFSGNTTSNAGTAADTTSRYIDPLKQSDVDANPPEGA